MCKGSVKFINATEIKKVVSTIFSFSNRARMTTLFIFHLAKINVQSVCFFFFLLSLTVDDSVDDDILIDDVGEIAGGQVEDSILNVADTMTDNVGQIEEDKLGDRTSNDENVSLAEGISYGFYEHALKIL